jgi:hypothetical protein
MLNSPVHQQAIQALNNKTSEPETPVETEETPAEEVIGE